MAAATEAIEWDEEAFAEALKRAREGVIHARRVRLSSDRLKRLLDAAPPDDERPDGHLLREAHFDRAVFEEEAGFREVTFSGRAGFAEATFGRTADFRAASFKAYADFGKAKFKGDGNFRETTFGQGAGFGEAKFGGVAHFGEATFTGVAYFGRAIFKGDAYFKDRAPADPDREAAFCNADFREATFRGNADFRETTVRGSADFPGAIFRGNADFGKTTFRGNADFRNTSFERAHFPEATFGRNADFEGASFERAREFGPIQVANRLWLDRAVFVQAVRIEASARRASFAGAVFLAGADVRLRRAEVWLQDAEFAEPSLVAGLQARRTREGGSTFPGSAEPAANGICRRLDEPPKQFDTCVLSMRGAKVAQLTLSGVDLRACRFAGAHGLDELRMERVDFAQPPDDWTRIGWRPVRWARRQTIAEEHQWRVSARHGSGWDQSDGCSGSVSTESDAPHAPWPPEAPEPVDAEQVARVYRALRKGREDSKDAPGAGDFYYGEMEMRRRSAPWAERSILWFYWLVSGYGLRASRALLALAVTIAVFGAIPLALWGFRPDRTYGRALLFGLESSISLLRAPEAKLTASGEVIQIFLRLAGPLFFGLAVLSLRGRVKR